MFIVINQHPWSFVKSTGARTCNGSPLAAHRCSTATSLVQKHLTYRTHWTTHWQNIPRFLGRRVWADATIRFLAIQSVYGYVYFKIWTHLFTYMWSISEHLQKQKCNFWALSPTEPIGFLSKKHTRHRGMKFWRHGMVNGENEEAKHAVCMYTNIHKTIHM